jgi:arylsulfatase A-like enzyme
MKHIWHRFHRPAAALAVLGLSLAACHSATDVPPNVVMIVVDTLRADRLGAYGNTRGLTPFLDQLAQRGVVFTNASAASSWTVPSVASLLTSRYPSQHHVVAFSSRLADEEVTFAERLRDAHYLSAGFSANFRLLERLGYAQGFDYWRSDAQPSGRLTGAQLREQGLAWLDGAWHRGTPRPLLLYFQFMEPHSPYTPPEPFLSRFARNDDGSASDGVATLHHLLEQRVHGQPCPPEDLHVIERFYDGEVATVDEAIRLLFGELERRGILEHAVIIITADHGEEFGEHDGLEHGRTLYDESIRVPLIVLAPGLPAGRRVAESVSLIDVAPTLLDLLGVSAEPRFEGRSLVPLMRSGSSADGAPVDVLFELAPTGWGGAHQVHDRGIRRGPLKLLLRRDGGRESYDLASDPGEQHPNPPQIAQQVNALASDLERASTTLSRRVSTPVPGEAIDDATKEKLRALGYHFF